jgi:hypothetical protein
MARDLGIAEWAAAFPAGRSLAGLQHALRKVTEALAGELRSPGASAPQWTRTEWAVARAVAAIHGVSPLLADTSRWHGPPEWAQFLVAQKAHTARRFLELERLLQQLDAKARVAAVGFVPLKGMALHAAGIYVAGERPMADVDLLVHEQQESRAAALLSSSACARCTAARDTACLRSTRSADPPLSGSTPATASRWSCIAASASHCRGGPSTSRASWFPSPFYRG